MKAKEIFQTLQRSHAFLVSLTHFNIIVDGLARCGSGNFQDVLEFIAENMEKEGSLVKPDMVTWRTLMGIASNEGNEQIVKLCTNKLFLL